MTSRLHSIAALCTLVTIASMAHAVAGETILHEFPGGLAGANPESGVVFDAKGNMFGTTVYGGRQYCCLINGYGMAYELIKPAKPGGVWKEEIISLLGPTANPEAGLVADAAGNFYAATEGNGYPSNIIKLQPPKDGGRHWQQSIIYSFDKPGDGDTPTASMLSNADGSLSGTTQLGGASGNGTIFILAPPASGKGRWSESFLYSFSGPDGSRPRSALVADRQGALYGTTISGGAAGFGVVFKLTPPEGAHGWTETTLYSFSGGLDGAYPLSGVVLGPGSGPGSEPGSEPGSTLYGTTFGGGGAPSGTLFKLAAPGSGNGPWQLTTLHSFTGGKDGMQPIGGIVRNAQGDLFGTARGGGDYRFCEDGCGEVFKLSPTADPMKPWRFTALHRFGRVPDGFEPYGFLAFDPDNNLIGTTYFGGYGFGIVFKIDQP